MSTAEKAIDLAGISSTQPDDACTRRVKFSDGETELGLG